jgi:ribosomal protein S18 acetylase RimI-like enzyme
VTNDGIEVRHCSEGDVDSVMHLWSIARSRRARTPERREDVSRLVEGGPAALLLAEAQGDVVGAVIAGWDGWRGNIYRLAIHPDHRRRGIGSQLTEAAESYFRERGVTRVTALVAFDDGDAGAFWDSVGYPPDEEMGRRVRNI